MVMEDVMAVFRILLSNMQRPTLSQLKVLIHTQLRMATVTLRFKGMLK